MRIKALSDGARTRKHSSPKRIKQEDEEDEDDDEDEEEEEGVIVTARRARVRRPIPASLKTSVKLEVSQLFLM